MPELRAVGGREVSVWWRTKRVAEADGRGLLDAEDGEYERDTEESAYLNEKEAAVCQSTARASWQLEGWSERGWRT